MMNDVVTALLIVLINLLWYNRARILTKMLADRDAEISRLEGKLHEARVSALATIRRGKDFADKVLAKEREREAAARDELERQMRGR